MKDKPIEWTDQPKMVRDATCVCQFVSNGAVWQIRYGPGLGGGGDRWFLTAGSLFESHTVEYDHHLEMLEAMGDFIKEAGKDKTTAIFEVKDPNQN